MGLNIERRVSRVSGHLNDLLRESFAEEAKEYEVVSREVDEYVNNSLGLSPVGVSSTDRPTYEFYLKPRESEEPRVRVMILHGPDLRARIVGGIKNEREHYGISSFGDNLGKAIMELNQG